MGMSGHAPGYVRPSSRWERWRILTCYPSREAVTAVSIATTVLAGVAVITRLCTRIGIVKNGGLDDGFIAFALVGWSCQGRRFYRRRTDILPLQLFSIATTITFCLQVKYGTLPVQED
jgi:hypothetical protein